MLDRKHTYFWPLRSIAVFSLIGPAAIFAYATWQDRREIDQQANERIERALDVLQEHALKALQTVERSISEINEVIRDVPDEAIQADEADFFLRFKRTQQALPQIEAIWVFARDGRPLVSSTIFPVPRNLDNSDRTYFRAQQEAGAGTYIGEVVKARIGSITFFVVSGRRNGAVAGRFDGVIAVTVMPEHFSEFYRKLTRGDDSFALVRAEGDFLARFPDVRLGAAAPPSELSAALQANAEAGRYTATSKLDDVERRFGYRKVPGFPVYVESGIETAALKAEYWTRVASQLAIGLPAVVTMFGLALYALRRAERFHAEIERREVAEAALKQAQRLEAIGQLTGGVAHDFNNLLMVVNGNADRLKRTLPPEERTRRALDAIETAVKRGTELTRQLLSFSRRQTHETATIDLMERLPVIQSMLQSSLRGDIVVDAELPAGLWPIKIDISEFELALLNLAVNARDAMSAGGRLTISARNVHFAGEAFLGLSGDYVSISVQDTGTGIAPETMNRVFEPFFTTKEVGKGTGLGLSQVYGFAQQAGGTATIDSKVGHGTKVTLYLPRSEEPIQADAANPAVERVQPISERVRVLLVEDNSDVADITRDFLRELGYRVTSAVDVQSAIARLQSRQEPVDVVLTDIVMPGGRNGLDLARWVRAEYGRRLPVILATGYSDKAQAAAEEGFTILRKPFDTARLRDAIDAARRDALDAYAAQ